MVLVFHLAEAAARFPHACLSLLLQKCFLLPADLVAHSSLRPDQILELGGVSLNNEWVLLLKLVLFLEQTPLGFIVEFFAELGDVLLNVVFDQPPIIRIVKLGLVRQFLHVNLVFSFVHIARLFGGGHGRSLQLLPGVLARLPIQNFALVIIRVLGV